MALLFITSNVYAQSDNELINGVLRAILGDLPLPCSTLGSATCTYCISYLKLLPFAFFFGFFYLMFVFITYGIRGRSGFVLSRTPSVHVAVLLISALLSIFLLHTPAITSALTRVNSFMNWINWGLTLLSGMLIYVVANRSLKFLMDLIKNASTLIPGLGEILNGVWFQSIFRLLFTVLLPFLVMFWVRGHLPDKDVGNLLFGETSGIFNDVKVCTQ